MGTAHAQAVPDATGAADPGQAGERFRQEEMTAPLAPDVSVRQARRVEAPAGAENITFTLSRIDIQGASVYSDAELKTVYESKVGKTISLADLYGIANDLTLKYRNDGYILTQVVVPPQTIDGGIARLRVVEGFVDKITIRKENESSPINMNGIRTYAEGISHGKALNVRDLERQLLIINDLPGVTARSILSPSPTTPGASDMEIILAYDPVDGIVSIDNFGSRYLGPVQIGSAATVNSILGRNEAISAQAVVAPQSWYELAYGSLGYEEPIGPLGTKIHFNANVTDTDPGYDIKQFDVKGRAYLLNVGFTHPFIRSRTENLTGHLNFDWRRVRSSNNIEEVRRDRISALRLGGRYEFIDTLITPAANTFDVEISKGVGIFGTSEEGDENTSRPEADPQFTKLELQVQRLQRVVDDVNLFLAARGQIASNALLSSEEFVVGGLASGRGYDPSEISGDHGVAGTVELQWNRPINLKTNFVESYQLYGFYDIGRVWNEDATTALQERDSLAATGIGLRFELPQAVEAGFAIAVPLTREPATANDRDPRYYFNLSKRF